MCLVRESCRQLVAWRRHELAAHDADRVALDGLPELPSMSIEDVLAQREWFEHILRCLPENQRIAVDLRIRCSCSYEMVSAVLGCAEATTRVHVWRGLSRLRQIVRDQPPPLQDDECGGVV